jgi:hypothetical protein
MHHLRHPIRSITEPFGKAGLTVAILALVFAMVGGAYAAGGLTKSQEKQVTKIAKKYAGKPGAPGANGANGTNGSPGAAGKDGTNGTNGTSAEAVSFTGSKGTCTEGQGGLEVKSGGPVKYVCNGKEGEPGAIHPSETLPSEATETGSWAVGPIDVPKSECFLHCHTTNSAISFVISLPAELDQGHIAAVTAGGEEFNFETISFGTPVNCLGSVSQPEAKPGFLCVYVSHLENTLVPYPLVEKLTSTGTFSAEGASRTGALLQVLSGSTNEPELVSGWGSWAVTAE